VNVASERTVVERLLQGGMALSTLLFLAGLLVAFSREQIVSHGLPLFGIASAARDGDVGEAVAASTRTPRAATPVVRVLALAYLWARERDLRFLGVALAVAAILGFSILCGRG
jgi:hypothetical protein